MIAQTMLETVFLYLGSSRATVKGRFLRSLTGPLAKEYRFHFDIPAASKKELVSSLQSSIPVTCERIVVVVDLMIDDFKESLALVLEVFREMRGKRVLPKSLTICEIMVLVGDWQEIPALAEKVMGDLAGFESSPFFHCYVTAPNILEPARTGGSLSSLHSLLTALASVRTSMGTPFDEGLTALRYAKRTQMFAAGITNFSISSGSEIGSALLEEALLQRVFSRAQIEKIAITALSSRIEKLLQEHQVGSAEGTDALSRSLLRSFYRDKILNQLGTYLISGVRCKEEFLTLVEDLASRYRASSPPFQLLLEDLRNGLIKLIESASRKMSALHDMLTLPKAREEAVHQAEYLVAQFGFPLWPLFHDDVKPTLPGLEEHYRGALEQVTSIAKQEIWNDIRKVQRDHQAAISRLTLNSEATRWHFPKSFRFMESSASMDDWDEIWTRKGESAVLVLLERIAS